VPPPAAAASGHARPNSAHPESARPLLPVKRRAPGTKRSRASQEALDADAGPAHDHLSLAHAASSDLAEASSLSEASAVSVMATRLSGARAHAEGANCGPCAAPAEPPDPYCTINFGHSPGLSPTLSPALLPPPHAAPPNPPPTPFCCPPPYLPIAAPNATHAATPAAALPSHDLVPLHATGAAAALPANGAPDVRRAGEPMRRVSPSAARSFAHRAEHAALRSLDGERLPSSPTRPGLSPAFTTAMCGMATATAICDDDPPMLTLSAPSHAAHAAAAAGGVGAAAAAAGGASLLRVVPSPLCSGLAASAPALGGLSKRQRSVERALSDLEALGELTSASGGAALDGLCFAAGDDMSPSVDERAPRAAADGDGAVHGGLLPTLREVHADGTAPSAEPAAEHGMVSGQGVMSSMRRNSSWVFDMF